MTTTAHTRNEVDIEAVTALTEAVDADPAAGATTWKARVDWSGGFRSEATIRDFSIIADEPAALGGTDTAPNPVELLLASLGGCLAVGVAANATARGLSLDSVAIDLEGDLDLATFLGLGGDHAGFSNVRATITVAADADGDAVADLIDHVVATSPVGHTLTAAIPVTVTTTV